MVGFAPPPAIHVLLVSPLPPPPGGIQTWTQILLERGLPAPFEFEVVDTRVTRRHQDIPARLNWTEIKRFFSILANVRRQLRSRRFSIMHLNVSPTYIAAPRNLLTAMLARGARVPYVVHIHGTFDPSVTRPVASRLYRLAYRMIFRSASTVIGLGQPSYRGALELGDFKQKIIPLLPNFIDFADVPSERSPRSDRTTTILYSGALTEAKGIFAIVDVAEQLNGTRFVLVGDGPPESRAELVSRISARRLEDRLVVHEPVTHREVLAMLASSDVFLFPSTTEGFPISVAEAMAVGLPVVASPVGAIPEMVDVPDGGFLISGNDVRGYVEALTQLRDDPDLRQRMGRYNRAKARREYDFDVVVERLCVIYRNALDKVDVGTMPMASDLDRP